MNVRESADCPPPPPCGLGGLYTVTATGPSVSRSDCNRSAVRVPGPGLRVTRSLPLKRILEVLIKPLPPVIVIVWGIAVPTGMLGGVSSPAPTEGTGLFGTQLTVNSNVSDAP